MKPLLDRLCSSLALFKMRLALWFSMPFFLLAVLLLMPGIARAGDLAPTSPVAQLIVQNLWLVAFALALWVLAPLFKKGGDLIDAYRQSHKTTGLADTGLKLAALLSRAAAAGVVQVESQFRPTLQGAGADGKLTVDEQKQCRDKAVALGMDWLKSTVPGLLAELGISADALPGMLAPHVEAHAAVLASGSRMAMERAGDTIPGVAVPVKPAAA